MKISLYISLFLFAQVAYTQDFCYSISELTTNNKIGYQANRQTNSDIKSEQLIVYKKNTLFYADININYPDPMGEHSYKATFTIRLNSHQIETLKKFEQAIKSNKIQSTHTAPMDVDTAGDYVFSYDGKFNWGADKTFVINHSNQLFSLVTALKITLPKN